MGKGIRANTEVLLTLLPKLRIKSHGGEKNSILSHVGGKQLFPVPEEFCLSSWSFVVSMYIYTQRAKCSHVVYA